MKRAQNAPIQTRTVIKFIIENGSINRYEAEAFGICHLAARVQNLEEQGFVYWHIDENNVLDAHGIAHSGIRRYFPHWEAMDAKARHRFLGVAA